MADENKDTSKAFNSSSGAIPPNPPATTYKPVAQPISKKQIDELHKQLSKPVPAVDYVPPGSTANDLKKLRVDEIRRKLEEVRRRLGTRKGAAKESFGRGVSNNTIRRKPG